jgi:heterogeneous nuclear ribonucleoprotein U-like protein 1
MKKINKTSDVQDTLKSDYYMLIGLPASGKSTWTNNFIQSNPDTVVISTDNIIDEYATQLNTTYDDVFDSYIDIATEKMKENLELAFYNHSRIIHDQTNLSKKSRKTKIDKIDKSKYNIIAVVFNVDNDILVERLNKRAFDIGKSIPHNILENMKKSYCEPIMSEGFAQILYVW